MSRIAGYDGTVEWDSNTTIHGITRWELIIEDETPDATGMDSGGWRDEVSGLRNWQATVDLIYDSVDNADFDDGGSIAVGNKATLNLDTTRDAAYYYEGTAFLKRITPTVEVDGVVKVTLEFIGKGEIGYCTTTQYI